MSVTVTALDFRHTVHAGDGRVCPVQMTVRVPHPVAHHIAAPMELYLTVEEARTLAAQLTAAANVAGR